MSAKIVWETFSEEEQKKIGYDQLWGENSTYKDPLLSSPYNVLMPKYYASISDKISNFKVRPDDVWIVTYPKCGTTWIQEIVWHIMNDVNKELGRQLPLFARSPHLEMESLHGPKSRPFMDPINTTHGHNSSDDPKHTALMKKIFESSVDMTENLQSPRIIKSHMPFELLPPNLLDTARVIYVCRNPKDVCVSFYHHTTDVMVHSEFQGSFDQYADLFMEGKLVYGGYFDHLKSAWKHRSHPNMKFLWYEDMRKNTMKEVTELAKFVDHPLSEAKIEELVEHLRFQNMKERSANQMGGANSNDARMTKFYRKGKVGDWKNYLTGKKLKVWDEWISNNLEGSDDISFTFE